MSKTHRSEDKTRFGKREEVSETMLRADVCARPAFACCAGTFSVNPQAQRKSPFHQRKQTVSDQLPLGLCMQHANPGFCMEHPLPEDPGWGSDR